MNFAKPNKPKVQKSLTSNAKVDHKDPGCY